MNPAKGRGVANHGLRLAWSQGGRQDRMAVADIPCVAPQVLFFVCMPVGGAGLLRLQVPQKEVRMVSAVGPVSSVQGQALVSGVSRPVSLDADLATCERQLSDWVHCVSASTPEGKAKIEELSLRLGEIKSRMQEADQASVAPSFRTATQGVNGAVLVGEQTATGPGSATDPQPQLVARPVANALGGHLDVFI